MPARDARASRASIIGLTVILGLAAIYLLHAGRGTSPFFDEWDWITRRRGVSAETLLGPHNGHLSLVPVVMYKVLLQTAGIDHYWVFRTVLVVLHLGCAIVVFRLARARVGDVGAMFAAGFVAVLGAAGDDLLWAFQIGFVVAVLLGLGALLALDRDTRRGDIAAAVLLASSLASASVGAAFAVAVLVEIVLHPRRRERWWVIVAPLVLYALWYLGYGESEVRRENLGVAPVYAAESGSAAAGGVLGLTLAYGRILLVGLAAATGLRVWRADRLGPRLVALALAPPALWVLTALTRAQYHEPAAPRYIYTGAILLVLLTCELLEGQVVPPRIQAVALLGILLAFAAVSNAHIIDTTSGGLRQQAADVRARLGALDLVSVDVDPGLQFSPQNAPQLVAGLALSAERAFGHIGLSAAALAHVPQAQGQAADDVLRAAGALRVAPGAPPTVAAPPPAAMITGGRLRRSGGCVLSRATSSDARVDVIVPDGEAVVVSTTEAAGVLARRFAATFTTQPVAQTAPGGALRVETRADASPVPWHVVVASAGNVKVCRAGA